MAFFNVFKPARPTPRTTMLQDRQMSRTVGGANEAVRIQGLMQQRANKLRPTSKAVNQLYRTK